MGVHIRWHDEEVPRPDGGGTYVRGVAWVVAGDESGSAVSYLAYLGANPHITKEFKLEFSALYPHLTVDWEQLEAGVEKPRTSVNLLSFDELAFRLRSILGEHGFEMDAVDTDFGKGRTRPLRDVERLVARPAVVARFERTSGSVFGYLRERHPDYAYALLKVRLLLEARDPELRALEGAEPAAGKGGAHERKDFYVKALQTHLGGN